jgi:FAD/FMN-containing dehydrogenase
MGVGAMPEVEELRARFAGPVVAPGDASYDEVRRVHNGLVDKHPALIVRCAGAEDVVAAVRLGRDAGLEISVRGGGHNVAGKAVTDGGVMIDLALLKQIEVDPASRTITAGGGVTWGELNQAAHAHGLATTGGLVSTTGIAGLTLGGGIGWLLGKHGLAIDNLLSAEVVLASGAVVQASQESEPDLFWAIRGGGGNFGAVTEFCYRAHPLGTVLGGAAVHPLAATAEVFAFYRDFTQSLPDDLSAFLALRSAPDGSGTKLCGVAVCHAGEDEQQAEAEVKPVREFGPPAMDLIERIPYPVVNTLIDDAFQRGAFNYWKSAFFTELNEQVATKLIDAYQNAPTPLCFLVIEHFHGAAVRVDPSATAFPHRQAGYDCIIISQWSDPAETEAGIRWARETYESLRPHMTDGAYVNYLDNDDAGRVGAAYGPNYDRLAQLKRKYDPDNTFRLNQNITP